MTRILYLSTNVYSVLIFAIFTAYLTSLVTSNHVEVDIRWREMAITIKSRLHARISRTLLQVLRGRP